MTTQHLNQTQLAVRWTISPRTLERWRWLGQGPRFLKIGGRVIYRLEDIQLFEAKQSRASTNDDLRRQQDFVPDLGGALGISGHHGAADLTPIPVGGA